MEPFIGMIVMFGGNFAPRSWAECNGQLLPIAQNTALFSILGTTYGGDGETTFGLPGLRGRMPIHYGNGPGLPSYPLGTKGGNDMTTLTINNMPNHNHGGIKVSTEPGEENSPTGVLAVHDGAFNEEGTGNYGGFAAQGGGQSFTNMPPYLAINFIIALVGTFPSRN